MTTQQLNEWATPALWQIHGLISSPNNRGQTYPLLDLIFCTLDDGNGRLSPRSTTLDAPRWELWKQLMYDDSHGLSQAILSCMQAMQLHPPNPGEPSGLFEWAEQVIFFTLSSVPAVELSYDPFGHNAPLATAS